MRLDAFLLADAAAAGGPDGKAYIHGVGVSRINAPALPLHVPLAVYTRLVYDEEEFAKPHTFTVRLTDPEGTEVVPSPTLEFKPSDEPAPELPEGEERHIQLALSMGVTFARAGVHSLHLTIDGVPIRTLTFPVVVADQPQEQTNPIGRGANRAERRRQGRER